MGSMSESSVSQWSMATHPQYDNARKRKLREERDNRSMVPLDSGTADDVAAVRLSGGTAIDKRRTEVHPPKPDVDGFDPAPNSDGQEHGNGEGEQMGPPSIKLEPVEENIALVHDTRGSLTDNALDYPGQITGHLGPITDHRDYELDWKSGEIDRRERELERRERELERRERELDRKERAFEDEKMRWAVVQKTTRDAAPQWQDAIDALRNQIRIDFLAERKENRDREAALEAKIMKQLDDKLYKERRSKAIDLSFE